jgi:hypothetical protein
MNKIITNCKDCVFSELNDDNTKQTGCGLDRSDKLGVGSVSDEGYFNLKRFCKAYRPAEWTNRLDFEEQLDLKKSVMKEIYPRLGFFVKLETGKEGAISDLENTIVSITKLEGGVTPYVVVITDKVEYNEEIWELFIKYFGEESEATKYHILQMAENPDKLIRVIDNAFGHAQNGWIMVTSSGEEIDKNSLEILNRLINIEMKQIVMVEPYDGFNGLMFPAYLFKFLNGNKTKIFSDEEKDSNDFITKVKNAETRSDTKHIIKWEEFYAA